MKKEIYQQIIKKKEFSQLAKKDIEMAFMHFEKRQVSDVEKIRLTRDLLRKVFSAFVSKKLLSLKNKDVEWILRKHISTRERLDYYEKLYSKLLKNKKYNVIDLGAGINGFSYKFFKKNLKYYFGVEAMGQLVELTNYYFKNRGLENASVLHMSLFELEKLKKYIKQINGHHRRTPKNLKKRFLQGAKIVFLFKTLDSLEMLEKNYSKKLLKEIVPLVSKVVVSFATRSLISKKKFKVNRNWILSFIKDNFNLLDDFELGNERYFVFSKK